MHLSALKALQRLIETWDDLLIELVTCILNNNTGKEWEATLANKQPPKIDEMMSFFEKRCQILESVNKRDYVMGAPPTGHTRRTTYLLLLVFFGCPFTIWTFQYFNTTFQLLNTFSISAILFPKSHECHRKIFRDA